MAQVTEVTSNCADICPNCGWNVVGDNGLIVITCKVCGADLISLGESRTYDMDIRTEMHEDGSATVHMGDRR